MSHILRFDDDAQVRAIDELYATPDVVEQRRAVLAALALRPGERVLDIGSGPGYLAAEMAGAVGAGGLVHGIDASPGMLEVARRRARAPGSAPVELVQADATALPFPDGSFDAAVSTQVYEYVEDMPAALAEARRVLVPGGRLLVLDTDWDSAVWRSGDDARMARVLEAWDDHLVHPDLPRRLPSLLRAAGFTLAHAEVVSILNIGYERATYSGGMLEVVARFVAGRGGVSAEEAEAWAADLRGMGADYFFSVGRFLFVAGR